MSKHGLTFNKEKEFLIAVDSDGCVFDNMTIKHRQFFFPKLLEVFEMDDNTHEKRALWDYYNLEYPHRGTNRFVALHNFFATYLPTKIEAVNGYEDLLTKYTHWIETTSATSEKDLAAYVEKTNDPLCIKVLVWSRLVNASIKKDLGSVDVFLWVKESLEQMSQVADIVVVSSANTEAVNNEWHESCLDRYVRQICSQNDGTKVEILEKLIAKGYKAENVLMVGDARGDYLAAKQNGAHYYEITYKEEVGCWKMINDKCIEPLLDNEYLYNSEKVLKVAMEDALKVIKLNVDDYTSYFQHVSENGVFPKEENKLWTMSFYPGQLYLAYDETKDDTYISHREEILASFRKRCDEGHMATHDIGFLFELTAYYDYVRTGDEASKQLFLDAADKLMLRYHEVGGFIQAWGQVATEGEDTRIIIDCMMNLPLLHLATKLTGDPKYAKAATSHAMVSSKTLIRDDYSSFHTYWMSTATGEPVKGATHQGHKDESTWARGQAWAVYGFYKSYEWTNDPYFLEVAVKCADVFLENLPKNDICYWDFDFTDDNPDIRDSSAASITAAGLLKIGLALGGEKGQVYRNEGIRLLTIMANKYQNNTLTKGCGILKEGMYHRDNGARSYTSWGDYYYVEALSTFFKQEKSS